VLEHDDGRGALHEREVERVPHRLTVSRAVAPVRRSRSRPRHRYSSRRLLAPDHNCPTPKTLLAIRPDACKEHQAAAAKWSRHLGWHAPTRRRPGKQRSNPRNPSGSAVIRPQCTGRIHARSRPMPTPANSPCPKGTVHT
jgi:hypothetical protein